MTILEPAIRLSNRPNDNRQDRRLPVSKTPLKTVTVADGQNSNSDETVNMVGQVTTIIQSSPNIPTDANYTISVVNSDGVILFTKSAIADNSASYVDISADNWFLPEDTYTITVSFVTVLSGDTVTIDLIFMVITP